VAKVIFFLRVTRGEIDCDDIFFPSFFFFSRGARAPLAPVIALCSSTCSSSSPAPPPLVCRTHGYTLPRTIRSQGQRGGGEKDLSRSGQGGGDRQVLTQGSQSEPCRPAPTSVTSEVEGCSERHFVDKLLHTGEYRQHLLSLFLLMQESCELSSQFSF
jgi:hypothetical protein